MPITCIGKKPWGLSTTGGCIVAKISYTQAVKDAIVKAALALRADGKSWNEALKGASAAGYKGGLSGLQKLVSGSIRNDSPEPKSVAVRKKTRQSEKFSSNAFSASKSPKRIGSATPERTNNVLPAALKTVSQPAVETFESFAANHVALREGLFFGRPISLFHGPFFDARDGELQAWSQILGREEALCVRNTNPVHPRGADVLIDSELNPAGSALSVLYVSSESRETLTPSPYEVNARVEVQRRWDGTAFVAIREVPPGAMLVLSNLAQAVMA